MKRDKSRAPGQNENRQVVLLIDGAAGLENMGRLCFKDCVQIVDFYHAMELNTPAMCWRRGWAKAIPITRSGGTAGLNGCSKIKSRR